MVRFVRIGGTGGRVSGIALIALALTLLVGTAITAWHVYPSHDDRLSVVMIASSDGFASGLVLADGAALYVVTTRRVVARTPIADVYAVERKGGRSIAVTYAAPVLWSNYELDLAILDISGARSLVGARLAAASEIDAEPARAPLTIWGTTLEYASAVGRADFVAIPARFVGKRGEPLVAGGDSARAPRRGSRSIDVWTKAVPPGFVGAPAFDERHRALGIVHSRARLSWREQASAEGETLSLISAEEIHRAVVAARGAASTSSHVTPAASEVEQERARVARVLADAAPAYDRLYEEHSGAGFKEGEERRGRRSSGNPPRAARPDPSAMASSFPDPELYVAPSDLRALAAQARGSDADVAGAVRIDAREWFADRVKINAFEAMTELLTLGGQLADGAPWSHIDGPSPDDPYAPLASQVRVVNGARRTPVCMVREHGRLWLSIFSCQAPDQMGRRSLFPPAVRNARIFSQVVGVWRLRDRTLAYLSSTDAESDKDRCADTIRYFKAPSTLTIRRAGDSLKAVLDTHESFYRPRGSGRCAEKNFDFGRARTRLGGVYKSGQNLWWVFNGSVGIAGEVLGEKWLKPLADEFHVSPRTFGTEEKFWLYLRIVPLRSGSILVFPSWSFQEGEIPTDLEPWDDYAFIADFVGMAGKEEP